jgi:hypothetical protein
MATEEQARRALVLTLLKGYGSSARSADEDTVAAYVEMTAQFSLEAVGRAIRRFLGAEVPGHDNSFCPTVPQLVAQAKIFQDGFDSYNRRTEARMISGTNPQASQSSVTGEGCVENTRNEERAEAAKRALARLRMQSDAVSVESDDDRHRRKRMAELHDRMFNIGDEREQQERLLRALEDRIG